MKSSILPLMGLRLLCLSSICEFVQSTNLPYAKTTIYGFCHINNCTTLNLKRLLKNVSVYSIFYITVNLSSGIGLGIHVWFCERHLRSNYCPYIHSRRLSVWCFYRLTKQITGMANPDRIQIFLEAKTCHCLESSGEIGITHTTKPRHFI